MQVTPSLKTIYQSARDLRVTMGTVLEVGPGSLWPGLAYALEHPDVDVVGVQYTPEERDAAWAEAKRNRLTTRARYHTTSGERFPLGDHSVDAIMTYGGLHQWPRPLMILDEMARVLKPGGKFFIGHVRRDASWLSTFWAGLGRPDLKRLYESRSQALDTPEFKRLMELSKLPECMIQTMGPDVWALSR